MGSLPEKEYSPSSHHYSMLQEVVDRSSVETLLVRSFKKSFNGFAANLTDLEAQKFLGMKEVVSVFPSRTLHLHTTRSWSFMGFNETAKRSSQAESDIIIGVLDTGIWPESASFSDEGFGSPPKKWKGTCDGGKNFTCNNKIIGARYYHSYSQGSSARDTIGHGSHTASTAAGNNVNDVSFYGLAQGTARGGVPSARIAVYKVCDEWGCHEDAVLEAFDDAISDGVDIITISLGSSSGLKLFDDSVSIGSFHAMEKGILTSQSAGNSGPSLQSVSSVGPWLLTVAASNTDRQIIDRVILGDGKTLTGASVNSFVENGTLFPLAYGSDASSNCSAPDTGSCEDGCLSSGLVKGKIVLCDKAGGNAEAFRAGAFGSIVQSDFFNDVSFIFPFPALTLSPDNYDAVKSYFDTTKNPVARILRSDVIKDNAAPIVASFSSRGPNGAAPDILKPDVTAPGVDILAAFSPIVSASENPGDNRHVKFNFISGTSMSCPHVAGIAAYIKTFHPDWSPSAIKSAIMTTAFPMNATTNPDREYAYGSGHLNPVKAIHPGLVYEATKADYIELICSLGYDAKMFTGDNTSCPSGLEKLSPKDFNYPSMTVKVPPNKPFKTVFHRTVTNVGLANSTYKAKVSTDFKLNITVLPEVLSFKTLNETKSFDMTVTGGNVKAYTMVSASLEWFDGTFTVRSPIVVHSE